MIFLDYQKGIHPECGIKYDVVDDIIITPFWTQEFCADLIKISELYKSRLEINESMQNSKIPLRI